jgi:hypothetical protein
MLTDVNQVVSKLVHVKCKYVLLHMHFTLFGFLFLWFCALISLNHFQEVNKCNFYDNKIGSVKKLQHTPSLHQRYVH